MTGSAGRDLDGALVAKGSERIVAEGGKATGRAYSVADEAQPVAMVYCTVANTASSTWPFNNAGIQVPPSDAAEEPLEKLGARVGVHEA